MPGDTTPNGTDSGTDERAEPVVSDEASEVEEHVFCEVVGTEGGREVLATLTTERTSVSRIVEQCSVSRATVYRHLDDLKRLGVVEQRSTVGETGGRRTLVRLRVTDAVIGFGDRAVDVSLVPSTVESRFAWLLETFADTAFDRTDE